jgi:fructokinase
MQLKNSHKVVCFGEVLWDILPTGAIPGGAPMNVAYHLYKLNKNPALITRIGSDSQGLKLKNIFSEYGLCTDYFQVDMKNETGKVFAKLKDDNEVEYDIVRPSAWDYIGYKEDIEELVKNSEYFVYGSLAARNKESKATLFSLLEVAPIKVWI